MHFEKTQTPLSDLPLVPPGNSCHHRGPQAAPSSVPALSLFLVWVCCSVCRACPPPSPRGSASSPLEGDILYRSSPCPPLPAHHVSPTRLQWIFLGGITCPPKYGVDQQAPPSQRMWQKPSHSDSLLWNLTPDSLAFEFSTTTKELEQIYFKGGALKGMALGCCSFDNLSPWLLLPTLSPPIPAHPPPFFTPPPFPSFLRVSPSLP